GELRAGERGLHAVDEDGRAIRGRNGAGDGVGRGGGGWIEGVVLWRGDGDRGGGRRADGGSAVAVRADHYAVELHVRVGAGDVERRGARLRRRQRRGDGDLRR